MFQTTKGKIKGIGNEKVENPQEEQIKANLQQSLAQQLQELSLTFKRTQKDYLQSAIASLLSVVSDRVPEMQGRQQKGNVLLDEYKSTYGQNFPKMGFDESQQATVDTQRSLIEERDKEIRKIAQSINEIVQIFKDMNDLIIEQVRCRCHACAWHLIRTQGTILDRIDHNLESAERQTEEAVQQIAEANRELKSSRTKYCILFLCLAGALLICSLDPRIATHARCSYRDDLHSVHSRPV